MMTLHIDIRNELELRSSLSRSLKDVIGEIHSTMGPNYYDFLIHKNHLTLHLRRNELEVARSIYDANPYLKVTYNSKGVVHIRKKSLSEIIKSSHHLFIIDNEYSENTRVDLYCIKYDRGTRIFFHRNKVDLTNKVTESQLLGSYSLKTLTYKRDKEYTRDGNELSIKYYLMQHFKTIKGDLQ